MKISNKTLYKYEILQVKYLPILISIIYLLNTLFSYYDYDICEFSIMAGISVLVLIKMYWSSYVYKLCSHHRMFLHYISIHTILDYLDYKLENGIPVSSRENLLIDVVLFGIFLILYIILKRRYDFSVKNHSKVSQRYC